MTTAFGPATTRHNFRLVSDTAASAVSDCIVVTADTEGHLSRAGKDLDERCAGLLGNALDQGLFAGTRGSTILIPLTTGGLVKSALITGVGVGEALCDQEFKELIRAVYNTLKVTAVRDVQLCLGEVDVADRDDYWKCRQQVITFEEAAYCYRNDLETDTPARLQDVWIASQSHDDTWLLDGQAMAAAINSARVLGDTPPNICTPVYIADHALGIAEQFASVEAEILNEQDMVELGMGALLSVGNASEHESRLVVLKYNGADVAQRPIVLVGKGITFDTGGTALKTRAAMALMKYDMCGAAVVISVLQAAALRGLPVNLVAVAACAENTLGSKASRPSDTVTSMSGKVVEILNPDAEGRLVLCDALTYAERFQPKTVIDVATLTGASMTALGRHYSAMFAYDDALAARLVEAGIQAADKVWRLPLSEEDLGQLDSDFADIANIGDGTAGCVVAALFLSRFAQSFRWAHLDISSTAKHRGDKVAATGRPAALLLQYLITEAEAL